MPVDSAVTPQAGAGWCAGWRCRRGGDHPGRGRQSGRGSRLAAAGANLCPGCRRRLSTDLRQLTWLYEECGHHLTRATGSGDRVSGGPLPGMPFNTAAADVRSDIRNILAAWGLLVAAERRTATPPREVPELTGYLERHLDWLAAHPAAADFSEELARLVIGAWRIIDAGGRRLPLRRCVADGCPGQLIAVLRGPDASQPIALRCSADPGHSWLGDDLLRLGQQLTGSSGDDPATSASWLSATDITMLWTVSSGSVYRLASEHGWRRRRVAGRASYWAPDVCRTLHNRRRTG